VKVRINGIAINYAERGLPQGTPLVMIHGFPFNHSMWDAQMMALPQDVRAVTFDLRGHGESDVGDGQYSIEFFVDDMIGLLDHLGIRAAALCGLSMGGYIALRAVERHPDRVRALVLCDTRSEPDTNEGRVKRAATVLAVKQNGVKPFARQFVPTVLAQTTLERHPDVAERVRLMIEGNSPLGICGALLAMAARTDTTPSLSAIKIPTLIIVGEHDQLTPPASARALHERIPGSAFVTVPEAAHLSNLENPSFFNEHLVKFLRTL